jgi:GNAT superfamily N-acetyltransferase
MALFYCDLSSCRPDGPVLNPDTVIERKRTQSEVMAVDMERIVHSWNSGIMRQLIHRRFRAGASLWLVKVGSDLAGYGWTLDASTIEPHYYQLGDKDVHLFDFFVFPEFRGRRLNVALTKRILADLAMENKSRAFIESAEWNTPQMQSLKRTPFKDFGRARKFRLFGRTLVLWTAAPTPENQGQ